MVQTALNLRPDGIILEIPLPHLNGLDAADQVRRKLSSVRLIFISVNSAPELAAEAFRRGASAYLPKQSRLEEFVTAVRKVMQGESYLSSLIARETMDYLLHGVRRTSASRRITSRQAEILQLLAEGKSMKEVAGMLDISPGTVAFHKYNMMEKLGIASNAELLRFAITECLALPSRTWAVTVPAA